MSGGGGKLAELEARIGALAARLRAELPERARALRDGVAGLSADEVAARHAIERTAHMVRGTAGSHGMPELTEPATRVEQGARTMPQIDLAREAAALADRIDATARTAPARAAPLPATAPADGGTVARPLASVRVLAIDDDVPTRRLLAMTLVNLGGASATIVETASAFFEALDAHPTDVVIVDAMMPEMNGLECLERIVERGLADRARCYFVLSAAAPDELRWELPGTLRTSWLRKPFRPRELLDAIRSELASAP
jgi:CheY-like chemotaxis protein